jgi:hypothetical protein
MIVLCRNCHGRKGSRPGQIDRKALMQYKANLAAVNGRYGDLELRILDAVARKPIQTAAGPSPSTSPPPPPPPPPPTRSRSASTGSVLRTPDELTTEPPAPVRDRANLAKLRRTYPESGRRRGRLTTEPPSNPQARAGEETTAMGGFVPS